MDHGVLTQYNNYYPDGVLMQYPPVGGMAAQVRPGQHTPRVVEGSWHITPPVRQLEDVVVVVVVDVVAVVVVVVVVAAVVVVEVQVELATVEHT